MGMSRADNVAGPGFEPGSQGYEPCEMPLLYPAMYFLLLLYVDRDAGKMIP